MARFTVSVHVARPPDKVHRAYVDTSKFSSWVSGYAGMETTAGKHGDVGSEHRLFFKDGARTVEVNERIVAHDPGKRFAYVIQSPYTTSSTQVEFQEAPGGTTLSWNTDIRGRTRFWALVQPLLALRMRRRVAHDLIRLKRLVETED